MDDVLAVCTDLFFQSRIASAARSANRTVRFIADDPVTGAFSLALVDLDADADVLKAIMTLCRVGSGSVVAFGPHVDSQGRAAARAAGASRVLAKSKFVVDLPSLLSANGRLP